MYFVFIILNMNFLHTIDDIANFILENCQNEVLPQADRQKCVKVICTSQNKYRIEE